MYTKTVGRGICGDKQEGVKVGHSFQELDCHWFVVVNVYTTCDMNLL